MSQKNLGTNTTTKRHSTLLNVGIFNFQKMQTRFGNTSSLSMGVVLQDSEDDHQKVLIIGLYNLILRLTQLSFKLSCKFYYTSLTD